MTLPLAEREEYDEAQAVDRLQMAHALETQIEQIVREVLARMQTAPSDCAVAPRDAAPQPPQNVAPSAAPPAAAPAPVCDELVLTGQVITLADLDGCLATVRRVVVPPRAVVTPAVRDELLRRKIALTYAKPRPAAAAAAGPLRLAVVIHAGCCDPAAIAAAIEGDSRPALVHQSDCVIAAADRLAAEVAQPDTLGLLLTRHVAAALCVANRLRGVRAVRGEDPNAVGRDAAAVGANLLVVDPRAGLARTRRIVAAFAAGGVRPCPKVFAERLN
jgi:hypothetical protein